MKIFRNAIAGALIAMTPISATYAAVRPGAAVPAAAATSAAQPEAYGVRSTPWLPLGIILATVLLAIYLASSKNHDGHGTLSRAS
ncbi:MAG: hypothetical protein ABIQ32_00990 [Sphingomicrobium sp.]